jgi:hypothetical protein
MCNSLQQFSFHQNPRFSPLMEIPQGNTWKIAENRTLKRGSSPPRAEEKSRLTKKDQTFGRFLRVFEPTLPSILAAEFGIEPEAWAGSGAQPAKPYLQTSTKEATAASRDREDALYDTPLFLQCEKTPIGKN